jgi:Tol biopolymer transport system component
MRQWSSTTKLASLLTAGMLASAACAAGAGSSGPSAPLAVASTPFPTVAATPGATAAPTPVAVIDGEPWIAYGWPRVATDGLWAIFLVRPDGSDAHEIAADAPGEHKLPAWSPDGKRIAFVVQDGDHPEGSIWIANADGSGAALLSGGGAECPVGLFHPAWSPDGTRLAVVCYPGGDDHESVAVLDLATTSIRRLADFTHPDAVNSAPTWSPDGRTIAFEILHYDPTVTTVVESVVATVPVEGGEVLRLTSPDQFMVHPDWRPDGAELVMNNLDPSPAAPSNLYAIRPDGSGLHELTHSSIDGHLRIETPRWDPDGIRILVSIVYTTGPDFTFGGEVRLASVDGAGGEPELVSTLSGTYPDLRPTP